MQLMQWQYNFPEIEDIMIQLEKKILNCCKIFTNEVVCLNKSWQYLC